MKTPTIVELDGGVGAWRRRTPGWRKSTGPTRPGRLPAAAHGPVCRVPALGFSWTCGTQRQRGLFQIDKKKRRPMRRALSQFFSTFEWAPQVEAMTSCRLGGQDYELATAGGSTVKASGEGPDTEADAGPCRGSARWAGPTGWCSEVKAGKARSAAFWGRTFFGRKGLKGENKSAGGWRGKGKIWIWRFSQKLKINFLFFSFAVSPKTLDIKGAKSAAKGEREASGLVSLTPKRHHSPPALRSLDK